jgi:hypothetical protein
MIYVYAFAIWCVGSYPIGLLAGQLLRRAR